MTTSSITQFRYQPEKIQAGTVYHYTKSNLDGSYPARIYIRVIDNENLEVWKFEEHNTDAARVTAHMDWATFSADRIQAWWVISDGSQKEQALLTSNHQDSSFTIQWREQAETIKIGHYPVHVYNFDFISLNFILRHWSAPQGEVEIGIVQPNFDPARDGVIRYEGKVKLVYIGDEKRNEVLCWKYVIGGEGLGDQEGSLWLDPKSMHVVDIEIPLPDNPSWNSFKFELISVNMMSEDQWLPFINGEIQKLDPVE